MYIRLSMISIVLIASITLASCPGIGSTDGEGRARPSPEAGAAPSAAPLHNDRVSAIEVEALGWGPGGVADVRAAAHALQRMAELHDALLEEERDWQHTLKAREAVDFFASRGSAGYLTVALTSPHMEPRYLAAQALLGLPQENLDGHRVAIVKTIVQELRDWRAPRWGSEDVTASILHMQTLCELLASTIQYTTPPSQYGVQSGSATTHHSPYDVDEGLLQAAEVWLDTHERQAIRYDSAR